MTCKTSQFNHFDLVVQEKILENTAVEPNKMAKWAGGVGPGEGYLFRSSFFGVCMLSVKIVINLVFQTITMQ